MRIVVDGRMVGWTGIGRYTRRLLQELAAIDPSSEYLVLLQAADASTWRAPGPNFRPVLANLRPHRWRAQLRLPALLRRLEPDLVHFPHFDVPVAYRGAYVVTVNDLTLLRYPARPGRSPAVVARGAAKRAVGRQAMRWAATHARLVITHSQFVATDLVRTLAIPEDRVVPIHCGVDLPEERRGRAPASANGMLPAPAVPVAEPDPVPAVPLDGPFLLYVGNMFPHKNVEVAVEAVTQLAGTGARLVLTGANDPWCARLRSAVQHGPAVDRVTFTGPVTDAQLTWLYRHAALLVQPSLSEGFGLTGLEAMIEGLPVVAARSSCLPEVYGDAAVYFDPHDARSLARAADDLLRDQAHRSQVAEAGRRHAGRYSWRATAEATLACYRAAVSGGVPPTHLVGSVSRDRGPGPGPSRP